MRGYVLLLLHEGTRLARIYSLAVAAEARGDGVATRLVEAAEAQARADGTAAVRLEVREDNAAARGLYERLGYEPFETVPDYYADGEPAVRMEKPLAESLAPAMREVPYYQQSVDFTCGPASLLMAMRALDPAAPFDRSTEFRLWRESTTVFMTSGHGGCSPYGLALAAHARGFRVEVYAAGGAELFTESVRKAQTRDIIRLVQQDYLDELAAAGVPVSDAPLGVADLERRFGDGALPVVLISTFRLDRQKSPHWVTVTGFDRRHVYIHDPWVDDERQKTDDDCTRVPIARRDFDRMTRYGRERRRAALLVTLPAES